MRARWYLLLWLVLACQGMAPVAAGDPAVYARLIKPLFRKRCYGCHGAIRQEAGLRLDTVALMRQGGDSGPALRTGDHRASLMWQRMTAEEPDDRMPPEGEGAPFTQTELRKIRDWIDSGAPAPLDEQPEADPRMHWSFVRIERPSVPPGSAWCRTPIDAFLWEDYQRLGLQPQDLAEPLILLRRLYIDLIGIPPTAEEIQRWPTSRQEDWYERLVDQLLDDPRYGQRWARHWMDIWRYSDWWGLGKQQRNSQPHIWHWRDWIVESLNADVPYDEMVRQMLAADELYPNDLKRLRATGYLARNFFLFNRHQWMDETVEHVSKSLLGLTMNCAKCHDHKYDPILQADYYRFRAFFEPYHVRQDMLPGEVDLAKDAIPRVYDAELDTPTYRLIRGQEAKPDTSRPLSPGLPAFLAPARLTIAPVQLPAAAYEPARRPWVIENYRRAEHAREAAAQAEQTRSQSTYRVAASWQRGEQLLAAAVGSPYPLFPLITQPMADWATLRERVTAQRLAVARARRQALEARWAALQAQWRWEDRGAGATDKLVASVESARVAAIRAERKQRVAEAHLAVAQAEPVRLESGASKRAAAEQALATAKMQLATAKQAAANEVSDKETYRPLIATKWSATRFRFSGKDDPAPGIPRRSTGRRRALAEWITRRDNPLTARVAVNHIWNRHFGAPLVPTVFDFGRNGIPPANRRLLDWLAADFMEGGWNMKRLHRLIVLSSVYRMKSTTLGREQCQVRDPDNRFWWRRPSQRMESQVVRDSILALGGQLDPRLGGPPVPAAQQASSRRRSLYFFHSNNDQNRFLAAFDEARVTACYRRDRSVVPQQSLALMHSRIAISGARHIANAISHSLPPDKQTANDFVTAAFQTVLGFSPNDREEELARKALRQWRRLPNTSSEDVNAYLVWSLLNHTDFVTVR